MISHFQKQLTATTLAVVSIMIGLWALYEQLHNPARDNLSPRVNPSPASPSEELEARERHIDETAWAKELLAQECGRTIEEFWDGLNAATNRWRFSAGFPVGDLALGQWTNIQHLPHGIELRHSPGRGASLSTRQWQRLLAQAEQDGWTIENVEFRQTTFDTDAAGRPGRSRFYFSAHLTQPQQAERATLAGDLEVEWGTSKPLDGRWAVRQIDASRLTIQTRVGELPFQLVLDEPVAPFEKSTYIDPLILHDLDGDGLSEIILAGRNLVYHRQSDGRYRSMALCRYPPGLITSAVVADFDGDGVADFLCAKSDGLWLYRGSAGGTFDAPGQLAWPASPPLKNAMVLTCGDINGDRNLDVFLGQYRVPTLGQILRPAYYDANDGFPSHLLLNVGKGQFKELDTSADLNKKRWRRSYSASLVDLDGDGRLDLAVASDFAGLDLYQSTGQGHFKDMTRDWVGDSHAFGMAHALGDFNRDGKLDLLIIGMPSPCVDRLEHLGLWRPDAHEDHTMRARMTYGNRLYLARPGGGFEQNAFSDSIARSGWSWGCGILDFDNDGFPDVYIANGLETKQSVRDYEPEFWLHDIYIDESANDAAATAYFINKFLRTRGQGWSYGGYERNRLFLNQQGRSFLEAGHLLGVAVPEDSRNVVADDLDGDGRVDLAVTTLEVWPSPRQTLRLYRNALATAGHWIGFRFRQRSAGPPLVGTQVTIRYDGHTGVQQIITGDSHRSQHANTVHFGLGACEQVEQVEIRWSDSSRTVLARPAANRYHWIEEPRNGH